MTFFFYLNNLTFFSLINYSGFIYSFNNKTTFFFLLAGASCCIIILPLLSNRFFKNKQQLVFLIFFLLIYFFIKTNNILVLFICYELFLLPSIMLVLMGSPNRRGVVASIFFLMWTQVGSFFVLLSVLYLFFLNDSFFLYSNYSLPNIILLVLFLGFGIKIPVWPFHFWLSKTHVEAPTYFSIYLSGFLVKTAIFGLWKFFSISPTNSLNYLFIFVSIIGIVDSSLKMWSQVDLKKLIAYSTVQEMNMILFLFVVNKFTIKYNLIFILVHTILSSMFFFINDLIYRRYRSRFLNNLVGLKNSSPNLFLFNLLCLILFSALPFTLKFSVEVHFFIHLFKLNLFINWLTIIIVNWVGLFAYNYLFLKIFFGDNYKSVIDLNTSEKLIFINLILVLVVTPLIVFLV